MISTMDKWKFLCIFFAILFLISLHFNLTRSEQKIITIKQTCYDVQKQDKPLLTAFIVSYCPYGVQMQRAIAGAIEQAPNLSDYTEVRYIGEISNGTILSMHGPAEAEENLRQICIREEQKEKYWNYISCFISSEDSNQCLEEVGIDLKKLDECRINESRGDEYAKKDFDIADRYGIKGSPTLLLNKQIVNEFMFGGRSPEGVKNLVCYGSNQNFSFCAIKLNNTESDSSFFKK